MPMYIPDHFKESHPERVAALIEGYPFGTLVTVHDGQPHVSHLPFLYERHTGQHGRLSCHLARANPQWRQLTEGQTVLAIFQGPHGYVSPAWYAAPGVPTWNYAIAHVYGVARIIEAAADISRIVDKLTAVHEARYPIPWQSNLSEEQWAQLPRAIVGLEIDVTEIQGKFKLSQNRSIEDRQRVIDQLRQSPSTIETELAALMAAKLQA